MAKNVDQALAELRTEMEAAVSRVVEDTGNYEARIAALEASQGTLTPAQETELEALKAIQAGLDPTNPNVLPPTP